MGPGLTIGAADAEVPLDGVERARVFEQDGRVLLESAEGRKPLVRGLPTAIAQWHLLAGGPVGRASLTVFGSVLRGKDPEWFPYDGHFALPVTLAAPRSPGTLRVLAPDGMEVEASRAGTVTIALGGTPHTLEVLRLPGATPEESELEIYFRDASNGRETYPAGRFVSLLPNGGAYLLDFNRARNPFCAYNTVYPCPAPWRGNTLPIAIRAGERYESGAGAPPAL